MSAIHDSDLYSAATNALASEASASNTYEKIINSAMSHIDFMDFRKEIANVEKIIRDEYGIASMPSPWRSAKSVVFGALAVGLSLLDSNGNAKGKSALQSEIKTAKSSTAEPIGNFEAALTKLYSLHTFFVDCTTAEKDEVKRLINSWS